MVRKEKIMNQKRIKIIAIVTVFLLAFPLHFIYEWFPNTFTAIFFPVNESIWEHMKILFDSFLLYSIMEFILLKHFDIHVHNFLFSTFFGALFSIFLYLIIYLPIYPILGESMFFNLTIMLLTIIIIEWIQIWIWKQAHISYLDYTSIIMMVAIYIVFAYLTFYPPKLPIFFDVQDEKYGITYYQSQT